jgi:SAM-dependent methyltransferase
VDRDLLERAYDRSAEKYDEQFRLRQREKYRAAARLLEGDPPLDGPVLDAGGGTGLFAEWLLDPAEPCAALREALRMRTLVVLDLSLAMLRKAAPRAPLRVRGDVESAPFAPRFALVVAFTSLLGDAERGVRSLGSVLAPGGLLAVTLLASDAPSPGEIARASGLRHLEGPVHAGQDRAFLLRRG